MALTQNQVSRICQNVQSASNTLISALDAFRAVKKEYDNLDFFGGATEQQVTNSGCGVAKAAIVSAVGAISTIESNAVTNNLDDSLYAARN